MTARPLENGGMMLKALKEAYKAGVPVISHCEDLTIIDGGIINEGRISKELGVKGMDRRKRRQYHRKRDRTCREF